MKTWSILGFSNRLSPSLLAAFASLSLVAGCQAPRVPSVPAFRQGVATANQQTATAFADINHMLRAQQLDRASRAPILNEKLFAEALPSDSLATWSRAFGLMEDYAGKLERLLSTSLREGIESELHDLGAKFSEMRDEPLPPGVGASFRKLGGILVEIKAKQDALQAMRKADPAVGGVFDAMAEAIGESFESGVRLTVWSSWTVRLGELQVEFLRAGNESVKRQIAERYLDMLEERDAHDRALASLRSSLLTLAKAHSDMALGDSVTASTLIRIVQDEYKALRAEIDRQRQRREN